MREMIYFHLSCLTGEMHAGWVPKNSYFFSHNAIFIQFSLSPSPPPLSLSLSPSFPLSPHSQVMIHPITHSSHSLLAHVKRREQESAGYPHMSSVGVTLVEAILSIIYDIQGKEPWSKAISQVQYTAYYYYPDAHITYVQCTSSNQLCMYIHVYAVKSTNFII